MNDYINAFDIITYQGIKNHILIGKRGGHGWIVEKCLPGLVVLKLRYSSRRKTFFGFPQFNKFSRKEELCFVKVD